MVKNKKDSGQALVEFALVVPLLLLVIFGTIEFGRIYHAQLTVASAAREGARKAAVTSDTNEIETAIENAAATLNITTVTSNSSITTYPTVCPSSGQLFYYIVYPDGSRQISHPVEVYIRGRVDVMVPIISNLIGTPKPLSSQAEMMVEY
ncbi:MAG: TadE/TadG family type IV pilus assembly protein [Bacillota bacterium]